MGTGKYVTTWNYIALASGIKYRSIKIAPKPKVCVYLGPTPWLGVLLDLYQAVHSGILGTLLFVFLLQEFLWQLYFV